MERRREGVHRQGSSQGFVVRRPRRSGVSREGSLGPDTVPRKISQLTRTSPWTLCFFLDFDLRRVVTVTSKTPHWSTHSVLILRYTPTTVGESPSARTGTSSVTTVWEQPSPLRGPSFRLRDGRSSNTR